jgi:hypothetical protein
MRDMTGCKFRLAVSTVYMISEILYKILVKAYDSFP